MTQHNSAVAPQNNIHGIFWALLATALFSATAAMAKVVVDEYHVLQILLFRQVVVLLSSLPALAKSFPGSLKTLHPGLHAMRLAGAFVALSCGIWSVAILPLTTAATLSFAQIFFVALLAVPFLKETVGLHRAMAIIAGFIGVVIVMRPGVDGLFNIAALIPLAGAAGAAIAVICVRQLSQTESTATLLVYQSVFVGVLAAIPLIWYWKTPDLPDTLFMLLMGVISALGQWTGIHALRMGEASVIANMKYTSLLFAALFGFVFFSEIPDRYTMAGAAVIIAASMYTVHRESRAKKLATGNH